MSKIHAIVVPKAKESPLKGVLSLDRKSINTVVSLLRSGIRQQEQTGQKLSDQEKILKDFQLLRQDLLDILKLDEETCIHIPGYGGHGG